MTNRFKGLDLTECLKNYGWRFITKCKKAKGLSEEALQIAEKRREDKGKGENKRYTYLNAEFQRRARRDKKASLSEQCKQIEENKRMGPSLVCLYSHLFLNWFTPPVLSSAASVKCSP